MLRARPWLGLCSLVLLLAGCDTSGSSTPSRGERPEAPEATAHGDEPRLSSEALSEIIDPAGHSTVRAREDRGERTFALVERDLIRAGWAEIAPSPPAASFSAAFDGLLGACLRRDDPVRCAAEISPSLGVLAATTGDHGSSWSVAVVQDGLVIARRSLVALSLHARDDSLLAQPSLSVTNLDADEDLELIVEVPLHALRDDLLLEERDEERGAVTYVLGESLNVEARWTSMWLVVYGDPEAEPGNDACTVTHRASEAGLILRSVCNEQAETREICPYDAEGDRFTCPPTFADQLFRPYVALASHYVGEDEDALRRALPGFGSRVEAVLRLAAIIDEAQRAPDPE